ncbi:hypothetical protein [Gemmatimonas sp.]|jgi:hypothetical protein|uniref:hypothetical protein n=1 Tax=Gemmatimonas sp. TaxID=1962908 RepID=UPI00334114B4
MTKKEFARTCTACGKGMNEGYCVEDGAAYYCGDACLGEYCTHEEWAELYADGEGDCYWTDWSEDPDNFEDDDEISPGDDVSALRRRVELLAADSEADALQRIEALERLVAALEHLLRKGDASPPSAFKHSWEANPDGP